MGEQHTWKPTLRKPHSTNYLLSATHCHSQWSIYLLLATRIMLHRHRCGVPFMYVCDCLPNLVGLHQLSMWTRLAPRGFLQFGFLELKKTTQSSEVQQNPVLFIEIGFFALKPKFQCICMKKIGVLPLLMITADLNTYDGSWNKTMVLFVRIGFSALKPNTQCMSQKKLGFFHPWCEPMQQRSINLTMDELHDLARNKIWTSTETSILLKYVWCVVVICLYVYNVFMKGGGGFGPWNK